MKIGLITALLLFIGVITVSAHSGSDNPLVININKTTELRFGTDDRPIMTAVRLPANETIVLDGFLNDAAWQSAPAATAFTQRIPRNGSPASEKTEVRVLYTDDALYVGFMAYDSAPDSIMAPLFRRDGNEPSDWVYVTIDSYNDNRTAFAFAVNPRGVQKDVLYYDDTKEDILWDAVWDARTQILDNGWSAEIRIPLSQLRFSEQDSHNWGINFQRRIARKGEVSFWAPTSQNENRLVSRFGELNGLSNIPKPRRLEILPYTAGSVLREPNPGTGNPFYSANQWQGNIGGDIQYGISSNMTLTATFNPDFGQVEADPAVINLSANQSFFAERRPFFLEGSEIFRFGETSTFNRFGNPITFYSRRIGRTPQGNVHRAGINAAYVDRPEYTTIASAVKLSGKTESGWSIGALNAVTLQQNAEYVNSDGEIDTFAAEPLTNYLVTRTKKDFNEGNTIAGGFFSAVHRDISETYFENFLHSSAYLGGLDFEHNFIERNWVFSGAWSYSVINGSEQAMAMTQHSPVRYYQRVDSEYLNPDFSKTSLTGTALEVSLHKQGGNDNFLGSITYSDVSPGYEVNDLGFQNRADVRSFNSAIVFRETNPARVQYIDHFIGSVHGWNYDGDLIASNIGTGGSVRFKNQWSINYSSNLNFPQYSDRLTRGGPVTKRLKDFSANVNIRSNPNQTVSYYSGTYMNFSESGSIMTNFWGGATARPATWIQISLAPELMMNTNVAQYIRAVTDDNATHSYGRRYIFAQIEQKTLVVNFRLNWTFSPTMSVQTYVRPFVSSGKYSNFKELSAPRTFEFDVYGEDTGTITYSNGAYRIDPDGSGNESILIFDPDFNFRSVQGNAVFRWEYRPGSTLFFVWQQQRRDVATTGEFDFGRDMGELFRTKPTNIFMVKLTYWFG